MIVGSRCTNIHRDPLER